MLNSKHYLTPKQVLKGNFFQHKEWLQNKVNKNVYLTCCRGSPHSKNCVYLITCQQGRLQYVGETGNTILVRFTQHRYNKPQKDNHVPLITHFVGIMWRPQWSTAQRGRSERLWINKLNTVHPRGLNEKFNSFHFHLYSANSQQMSCQGTLQQKSFQYNYTNISIS